MLFMESCLFTVISLPELCIPYLFCCAFLFLLFPFFYYVNHTRYLSCIHLLFDFMVHWIHSVNSLSVEELQGDVENNYYTHLCYFFIYVCPTLLF